MSLRIVADAGREPSPYFADAIALARGAAEQVVPVPREFRVRLDDGSIVTFSNELMAELFAKFWEGTVLP